MIRERYGSAGISTAKGSGRRALKLTPAGRKGLVEIWREAGRVMPALDFLTQLLVNSMLMNDLEFEWDPEKAARNAADHGVTFEMARGVFRDPFAIERLDDRADYGEDRYVIIGMADDHLLYVAYTMRGEAIRIISARGAEPHERRQYHEDNG